jgi:hypothetical protein
MTPVQAHGLGVGVVMPMGSSLEERIDEEERMGGEGNGLGENGKDKDKWDDSDYAYEYVPVVQVSLLVDDICSHHADVE